MGALLAYRVEQTGNVDLTPSPKLTNLKFMKEIKQMQHRKQLFSADDAPESPLIEIRNLNFFHRNKSRFLSKRADSVHILKDINLTIRKGSFTVIIGPNGSGKTTLLKALINLYGNFSGEIL